MCLFLLVLLFHFVFSLPNNDACHSKHCLCFRVVYIIFYGGMYVITSSLKVTQVPMWNGRTAQDVQLSPANLSITLMQCRFIV